MRDSGSLTQIGLLRWSVFQRLVDRGHVSPRELENPLVVVLRLLALPLVSAGKTMAISPNVITSASLACGLLAAYFLYVSNEMAFILLWVASVQMDYADGALARVTGKESHLGYLFDMFGDRAKLVALVVAWTVTNYGPASMFFGSAAVVILIVTEFVNHLFVAHRESTKKSVARFMPLIWLVNITVRFHMHSFLIFGVLLVALESPYQVYAVVWLALVLLGDLIINAKQRISNQPGKRVTFNSSLLKKLRLGSSES